MLVEPGFFRTELLTPESTNYAEPSIDDYAERTKQTVDRLERHERLAGRRPRQARRRRWSSSPSQDEPPLRWAAGADAVAAVEQKARDLLAQADAHRELSSSLAHDADQDDRDPP